MDEVICRLNSVKNRHEILLDVHEIELVVLTILSIATSLEISRRLYLGAVEMAGITRFRQFIERCS